MPRADKTIKVKIPHICKLGPAEREAFECLSRPPRFPKKLEDLKKNDKQ